MAHKKQTYRFEKKAVLSVLVLSLSGVFLCPSFARADDSPFQMDTSHWMSFDHYKDDVKRGHIDQTPPASSADDHSATASDPQASPSPEKTSSAAPAVAAPTRPIDLPIMPGINKGMGLQVNSTEDERPAPVMAAPTADAPADIHLPVKGWQDPVALLHTHGQDKDTDQDDDHVAQQLDVRMTYLPNEKIAPAPSPEHASAQSLANAIAMQQRKQVKREEDAKTPAQQAACEAIDAYKKQQLDAIQSDRQTLKALQDAISSLGLQKQLDFMTGKDSALNTSGAKEPANADTPAQTTIR